jgi:NitT/TauT family transport system substrate-binding protein
MSPARWRSIRGGLVRLALPCLALLFGPGTGAALAQARLEMAMVSRTVFYLPAWMAERQGFFADEGLAVRIRVYDSSEPIFADLKRGSEQIAVASIESTIAGAYAGERVRIVAGCAQRPPHIIIARPDIHSLAELKGKTIGVVSMHEGTTFFVADIARAGGFALSEVHVAAVGGSPTRQRLLREGRIDAGLQPYPLSYEAEAEGLRNLGPVAALVPDYQFTAVMVDADWAAAHRASLVGYLRALRRGTDYMFAHPEASAEVAAEELRTTREFALRAIADTARMDILSRDLSVRPESLRRVFANMQQDGAIGPDVAFDPARFVDTGFLEESRQPR